MSFKHTHDFCLFNNDHRIKPKSIKVTTPTFTSSPRTGLIYPCRFHSFQEYQGINEMSELKTRTILKKE